MLPTSHFGRIVIVQMEFKKRRYIVYTPSKHFAYRETIRRRFCKCNEIRGKLESVVQLKRVYEIFLFHNELTTFCSMFGTTFALILYKIETKTSN